ncbi:ser/threonine protein phosphatase [Pseudomonas matsuisoli]|uniref:Ser/threonine protein phosphatase n=2 Tax=Pseudomonas matsuisoli TaxID=1515666 RepID=A0A917PVA9_9PSED|nr:ser/threonine protein phosphatase [Pseudomonas matsuisoli]
MLSIIVGLHLLVAVSLIPFLPIGPLGQALASLYMIASCALMPIGFRSRGINSKPLAWASLMTMGIFSSLAVFALIRALVLGVLMVVGVDVAAHWAQGSAIAVLVGVGMVTLVGVYTARRVAPVKSVQIPLKGLPEAFEGFTIVQISDIHVGPTIKRRYIERIVERVNSLQPDYVAVTGDLVDGSVAQLSQHIGPLANLNGAHGVGVVTGNHEYYSGAPAWVAELRRMGLTVLMNEHRIIEREGAALVIAGITDYSAGAYEPSHTSDARAAIAGAPTDACKILLAHQPRSSEAARDAGFDLQLSGHTHGGQFWPWMHFVRMQQPWVAGIHHLGKLTVYISRGTGYWGPPIRFAAPSEITRIRLVAA